MHLPRGLKNYEPVLPLSVVVKSSMWPGLYFVDDKGKEEEYIRPINGGENVYLCDDMKCVSSYLNLEGKD